MTSKNAVPPIGPLADPTASAGPATSPVAVLVGLVYVALAARRLFPGSPVPAARTAAVIEGTARV